MANFNTIPGTTPNKPEPFTLHVPETDLTEFHELLKLSKIGPPTWWNQQTDGHFGVSREWLSDAKEAWLKNFNWRTHEAQINSVPNFRLTIHDYEAGSVRIHFAALFSKRDDAVPVLFLHGYPGSFMEFLPMMQLLVKKYTPETLPYHVVVPSLPDYGLSGGASENVEMNLDRAARIMNQLMVDLGFGDGYIAQGGDLGSMLARMMSVEYKECKALHINMLVLNTDEAPPEPETHDITPEEAEHLERTERWRETGFAYALEHGTRPSTIGLVVSSNPLALIAWIGEKHLEWTDPRHPLPLDTILSMASFYWFTSTFPRGLYHAALVKNFLAGGRHPITKEKPLGYSRYPYDMAMLPESWAREIYPNLVLVRRHSQGGHFAALEMPEAFLDDVEEFVRLVRDGLKKT